MQMLEFTWWRCRDGYRLDQNGGRFGLTSKSDQFEQYRPLEIPSLFVRFAKDTAASARGMQDFCSRFGLLGGGRPDITRRDKPIFESSAVSDFLFQQRIMRRALDLFERGDCSELVNQWNSSQQGLALVRTELRVGPEGRVEMVFVPPDLVRAMWFQFAQFACSQAQLFRCERCNEPFIVGAGTGRRKTAKYCSNACKVAAFKERHETVGGSK
jgi:hypothetical protein